MILKTLHSKFFPRLLLIFLIWSISPNPTLISFLIRFHRPVESHKTLSWNWRVILGVIIGVSIIGVIIGVNMGILRPSIFFIYLRPLCKHCFEKYQLCSSGNSRLNIRTYTFKTVHFQVYFWNVPIKLRWPQVNFKCRLLDFLDRFSRGAILFFYKAPRRNRQTNPEVVQKPFFFWFSLEYFRRYRFFVSKFIFWFRLENEFFRFWNRFFFWTISFSEIFEFSQSKTRKRFQVEITMVNFYNFD